MLICLMFLVKLEKKYDIQVFVGLVISFIVWYYTKLLTLNVVLSVSVNNGLKIFIV